MSAKPTAYNDRLLSFCCHLPGIFRKRNRLRRDQTSDSRQTDNPAVKMPGKHQICSPFFICVKINRIVRQKNLIIRSFFFNTCCYILLCDPVFFEFCISCKGQFQSRNPDPAVILLKQDTAIFQKMHAAFF